MKNGNLHKAKKEKNDEFYTQYVDIEKEIQHYNLEGMKIYCNCDDYRFSNFVKYFKDNFNKLKISHLTASNYDIGLGAYRYDFDGLNETITMLHGNGDFKSEECVELLKETNVVVSNPPFSLFREYIAQLMKYNKKFIIIGNGNAVGYKEIFPLIKENIVWLGVSLHMSKADFVVPETSEYTHIENGKKMAKVNNVVWFTNIRHNNHTKPLQLYKHYSPEEYQKYDNYDAIHCERTRDIPVDYDGVVGVPISFLDKYCPEQFEIVKFRKGNDGKDLSVNGKCPYFRILIRIKK